MDDVPVATNNPVNLIIKKQEIAPKLTRKDRIKESLKNFFIMLPIVLLVVVQFFFLGKSFGELRLHVQRDAWQQGHSHPESVSSVSFPE